MFTLSLKQVVPLAKSLNSVGDVTEYIHKRKISSRKMKLFLFPEKFKRFVECLELSKILNFSRAV